MKTETKHTPGPWKVNPRPKAVLGEVWITKGAFVVGTAYPSDNLDTQPANARLIAAAPELLEALETCEGNISSLLASNHPAVFGEWLKVVRAAIAKAKGGEA